MSPEQEFRAYMKAANSTTGNSGHLNEEQALAYYRGAMSENERDAVQAHFVDCDVCLELMRSARDFLEPAVAGDEDASTTETDNAWLAFRQRVETATAVSEDAETNVIRGEFSRARGRNVFWSSRISSALAASLLISLGILGLLGWRLWQQQKQLQQARAASLELESKQRELEQRLSQLEHSGAQLKQEREQRLAAEAERDQLQSLLASVQPNQPNIPVFPFRLSSERGSEEELSLSFKHGVPAVRLRLFQNKPYEYPRYAIELADQRGQVVRTIAGLRPARADGALNVLLNRGTLGTGKYKLKLFGLRGKARENLGDYELSVTVEH